MRRKWFIPGCTALVATAVLAAGCDGGSALDEPQGDTTSGTPAQSGATKHEITESLPEPSGPVESVVWAIDAEPRSLDNARTAGHTEAEIARAAICDSLIRLNPDRSTEPGLAAEIENPDATTWVYRIRDGVAFHDGSSLSAEDVVASLRRHTDAALGSVLAGTFANVQSIEATGPMEVTVKLKEPDYLFNSAMAGEAGRIESADFLEEAGRDYGNPEVGVNCTGPYRLDKWTKGQSITLTKADDYWDDAYQPQAENVTLTFNSDPTGLANALLAGDIDGTYQPSPSAFTKLQQSDVGELYFGPVAQVHSMAVNMDGILGDPRVRKALSMALDRQGVIDAGYEGYATPAKAVIGLAAWGTLPDDAAAATFSELPDTSTRDIDGAKRLIEEAGAEGKEIVIAYMTTSSAISAMAQGIYGAAQELGLKATLKEMEPVEFAALTSDPDAKKGVDMWPVSLRQAIGEPLETYVKFRSDNPLNYGGYSSAEYDAIVDEALAEKDAERRGKFTAKLQRIAAEELPWIPLVEPGYGTFINDRLTGAPTSAEALIPWAAMIGAAG